STLHGVTLDEVEAISDDTISKFQYAEHKENVALALKICQHLGVERAAALEGMTALEPEAGAMQVLHINYFKREIVFVNGFAANDPESTGKIWENMVEKFGAERRKIMLINCRADRPHRSQQMAEEAGQWTTPDKVILMGSGCFVFVRNAVKHGLDPEKLLVLEGGDTVDITETILEESASNALVVGMCNIHGGGEEVARFFQNRAVKEEDL
ncbi:MAG TPA: poly-gamma-glutamate synthase PgsB, partial [Idiomarina sp.]|nr:poly-gamma-glutamate synthase PgsB [Idiomarina sp.]